MVKCGRKEKHRNEIERGLNLRRRRKEKRSVKTKRLLDLRGNGPDRSRAVLDYSQRARGAEN